LAFLVLFCVQVVQTTTMNLVEKEKKKQLSNVDKQRCANLSRKQKKLNWKNLVDKIHKLIVKELKFNVNHNIKIVQNDNLLQV